MPERSFSPLETAVISLLPSRPRALASAGLLGALACLPALLHAQRTPDVSKDAMASVPVLGALVTRNTSDLKEVVERFTADQASLNRRYDASDSPLQRKRMREHYNSWRARLKEMDFDKLNTEGKADYALLDNHLVYQLALMDRADKQRAEQLPLMPFADQLLALQDTRREMKQVDPNATARVLSQIAKQVDSVRALFEAPAGGGRGAANGNGNAGTDAAQTQPVRVPAPRVSRTVANRAADDVAQLRNTVTGWYRYYDGYDPMFSWWMKAPYGKLDSALNRYTRTLRERVVGLPAATNVAAAGPGGGGGRGGGGGGGGGGGNNDGPIIGDPIGEEGLKADLAHEMIPYSPQELIAVAEKEYAFSLSEAKKAAREMGLGDDWKAAMEKVKDRKSVV